MRENNPRAFQGVVRNHLGQTHLRVADTPLESDSGDDQAIANSKRDLILFWTAQTLVFLVSFGLAAFTVHAIAFVLMQ